MDLLPSDAPSPRLCHLIKWPDFEGYGFNLHAEKAKMGQFIGKVDVDSPAQMAGLREGDRIIEVNGVNISTENHRQVVERIKSLEKETKLLVVDQDTDQWYKDNDLIVKSSQLNVIYIKTPVPRPSSDSPRAQQHQPPAPPAAAAASVSPNIATGVSPNASISPNAAAPVSAGAAPVEAEQEAQFVASGRQQQQQHHQQQQQQQQEQQQQQQQSPTSQTPSEGALDEQESAASNETRAVIHVEPAHIVESPPQQQQPDHQSSAGQDQPPGQEQQQPATVAPVAAADIKLNVTMDNDDSDTIEQHGSEEIIQNIGILKSDKKMRNGSAESSMSTTPDCSESNMSQSPVVRPDSTASTQSHDSILTGDDDSMSNSLGHHDLDTMKTMDNGTLKGSIISGKTATSNMNNNNTSSVNFMDCLNLNMTASEMRELISRRKKFDPKKAQMNIRQKYEIIQQM